MLEKESLVGLLSIQILSTFLKLHTGGLLVTVAVLNMISLRAPVVASGSPPALPFASGHDFL